ncbi:MAG: hypothetical protein AAF805_14360, partial [Planctomycetota bacterium]
MTDRGHRRTRLRDLLPGSRCVPESADPPAGRVRLDAHAVRQGDVYLHTDPFSSAGAAEAVLRGAVAVVAERMLPGVSTPQVIVEDCHAAARRLSHIPQTSTPAFRLAIAVVGAGDTEPAAQWIAATIACDGRRIGLLTESIEDDGEHCFGRGDSADASTDWATRCELGGVDTVVAQLDPQS